VPDKLGLLRSAELVGPWISLTIYALVAFMWFMPDRLIGHAIAIEP
jgi:hypothetical protein